MRTKKECEERELLTLNNNIVTLNNYAADRMKNVNTFNNFNTRILMAFLISLIFLVNVDLSYSIESSDMVNNPYLSLEKHSYKVGELLTIKIFQESLELLEMPELSLDVMNINYPENSFRYLGLLESEINFIPSNHGEYVVRLYDANDDTIDEISFYVNENSECVALPSEGNIIISKDKISADDSLEIIYKDLSTGSQQKFIYRGDTGSDIIYSPILEFMRYI